MATGAREPRTVYVSDDIWQAFNAKVQAMTPARPADYDDAVNAALLVFAIISDSEATACMDRLRTRQVDLASANYRAAEAAADPQEARAAAP